MLTELEAHITSKLGNKILDRRIAVGEREEEGRCRGRQRARSVRRIVEGHHAAGMGHRVEHLTEQALRVVRGIGKARGEKHVAHAPPSRATVKNSTFVAAA